MTRAAVGPAKRPIVRFNLPVWRFSSALFTIVIEYNTIACVSATVSGLAGVEKGRGQIFPSCCPNKNHFERSLKRFLLINLGEAEDQ